ncbi:MAG: hypothetical protein ACYDA3_09180 [Gaiellaceae bacterium]
MTRISSKQLAATAIAALTLTGASAAVAAASGGSAAKSTASTGTSALHGGGPAEDLAIASTYLGVGVATLQSDLRAGQTLADVAKVTSGKTVDGLIAALVTSEQAEHPGAAAARITQRVTDFVNGVRPAGGPGFGHGRRGFDLSTAASYLGLTVAQLQTDLQSGQTLAQVANSTSGKSADGLIQALVAAYTTQITAVVNGTATG